MFWFLLFSLAAASSITVQDLIKLERISSPVASPNGKNIAYLSYKYDPLENQALKSIHLVDADDSNDQKQLTSGFLDDNIQWVTDDLILFVRNGQLHSLSIKTNQSTFLNVKADFVKINRDSKQIAYTRLVEIKPDTRPKFSNGVVYENLFVRHWDSYVNTTSKSQLHVAKYILANDSISISSEMNLLKGTLLETPVKPFGDQSNFEFSPFGEEIAFTAKSEKGSKVAWKTDLDIFIVPSNGDRLPLSISSFNKGSDTLPVYSKKHIAWLQMKTPKYESDKNDIVLLNRKSGKIVTITENWDRSTKEFCFSPDASIIYAVAEEFGHAKVFEMNIETGEIKLIISENTQSHLNCLNDSLVFTSSSHSTTPQVFKLDLESLEKTRLTFANKDLDSFKMTDPIEFWFKGAFNEKVMGWMYKPFQFDSNTKYPVAFLIHGGPEGAWLSDFGFRWNPQLFAAAGFVVIAINFHGSTGYGTDFQRSILDNWGSAPFEDLMLGLDYAVDAFSFIDSDRICALGASYGGYMINWINGHTDRFACLVNHDGIFDTRAAYYATDELWFPEREFSGPEFKNRKEFSKWSPSLFVDRWKTPTLVIHGEKDYRLPVTEGLSTFTALQRQGIPSKLLYFPTENHWVLSAPNLVQWYETVVDWITQYTTDSKFKLQNLMTK